MNQPLPTPAPQDTRVAVIGAGLIGRSWAVVFARAGLTVALHDADAAALARAPGAIAASLAGLAEQGLVDEAPASIAARITLAPTLADALADADHVQENAPERLDLKALLFAAMDRLAPPHAVLASSSSALTASRFAADLPGAHRCLVAHPANPPHLLRAVEVVPAPFTAPEAVARTTALMAHVGQVPVAVDEIDGFVMNRLQAALTREALALVEAGVAGAEAIDAIVRESLGKRWSFMGPFETMDLNAPGGFADYAVRYGPGFAAMLGGPAWPQGAIEAVVAERRARLPLDDMPARTGWRDAQLAALAALHRDT